MVAGKAIGRGSLEVVAARNRIERCTHPLIIRN
jgi:hypothetical protein